MTLEELKAEADKLGYRLTKKPDYTCSCVAEYPRTPKCLSHEFVRKSKGGWTYCKKRATLFPEAME